MIERNKLLMEYHSKKAVYYKQISEDYKKVDPIESCGFYNRYLYHLQEHYECMKMIPQQIKNTIQAQQQSNNRVERMIKESDLETNWDLHSIPLTEFYMLRGKDEISALINPAFITVKEAKAWLHPEEPVIVVPTERENYAKAYPVRVLIWHEVVNDFILGEPIVVTFSPLCGMSYVYGREVDGQVVNFGTSGILRCSCTVMYDYNTESLWDIMTGAASVGDLTGSRLKRINSNVVPFSIFSKINPEGLVVLSAETGFILRYGFNPYVGYDRAQKPFFYPKEVDKRVQPMERVVGINIGEDYKAYPYSVLKKNRVVEDSLGDTEVVIFYKEGKKSPLDTFRIEDGRDIGSTSVFSPYINDERLRFNSRDNKIYDTNTNSEWSMLGEAIEGPLTGQRLEWIIHGDPFWFAWSACYPHTEVYIDIAK